MSCCKSTQATMVKLTGAFMTAAAMVFLGSKLYLKRLPPKKDEVENKEDDSTSGVLYKPAWFSEVTSMWPGQAFSLKIKNKLVDVKSEYQHIEVFETESSWGKVLVLDGIIQLTEKDEFVYHEMLCHIPVLTHSNPKKVLVIGGGDGGILRELSYYDTLEEIYLCDIDEMVINTCKSYFPKISCGFKDARVKVFIKDGYEFVKNYSGYFDIIIIDSTDPVGSAEKLFQFDFYRAAYDALKEDGLLVAQGESIWISLNLVKELIEAVSKLYPSVEYGIIHVPTYPCGSIGILACSKTDDIKCSHGPKASSMVEQIEAKAKYYTKDMHMATFKLPRFIKDALLS